MEAGVGADNYLSLHPGFSVGAVILYDLSVLSTPRQNCPILHHAQRENSTVMHPLNGFGYSVMSCE